jgi:hypothetical protein
MMIVQTLQNKKKGKNGKRQQSKAFSRLSSHFSEETIIA